LLFVLKFLVNFSLSAEELTLKCTQRFQFPDSNRERISHCAYVENAERERTNNKIVILISRRNLLQQNFISWLRKEFYTQNWRPSQFLSRQDFRDKFTEEKGKTIEKNVRDGPGTPGTRRVRAYVRRRLVGGYAHACVPMSLRSFIQTHIDLVVRRSEDVGRRGHDCRKGDREEAAGKQRVGETERLTAGAKRRPVDCAGDRVGPGGAPSAPHRPPFFSTGRGTSRRFSASRFIQTNDSQRGYSRGCVIDYLTTDDWIIRENVEEHPHWDAPCDAPLIIIITRILNRLIRCGRINKGERRLLTITIWSCSLLAIHYSFVLHSFVPFVHRVDLARVCKRERRYITKRDFFTANTFKRSHVFSYRCTLFTNAVSTMS